MEKEYFYGKMGEGMKDNISMTSKIINLNIKNIFI